MAKNTPKYIAVVGINFEGVKPPIRVEADDPIPERIPESELRELLAQGQVRERTEAEK